MKISISISKRDEQDILEPPEAEYHPKNDLKSYTIASDLWKSLAPTLIQILALSAEKSISKTKNK